MPIASLVSNTDFSSAKEFTLNGEEFFFFFSPLMLSVSILDGGFWELKSRSWQEVLCIVYIFLLLTAHANKYVFFFFSVKFPCCGVLFFIPVLRMNFPLLTWYTEVCSTDGFNGIPKLCIFLKKMRELHTNALESSQDADRQQLELNTMKSKGRIHM